MAKKGEIKYTDLFASDVHYGLLELEEDFKKLDQIAQSFSKTITGTKARVKVVITQETQALKENKEQLIAVDVASHGAADAIGRLSKSTEESLRKTKALKDQQEGLNKVFELSRASVDDIKRRIVELTKEYNSLGRVTDQDKTKMKSLATEVGRLKREHDLLASTLKKASQSVEVAENSYTQASKKLNDLRKSLREMPNAINRTTGEWNKANPAVIEHLREITKLDASIKKMDATMGQHQRSVGNYRGSINGAISSIAGWASAYLSATEAIRYTFDKSLEFDAIRTSLSVSLGSMEAADEKMQGLRQTAERLGIEYVTLAKSYKQFIGAAIASEFPLTEAEKIFQSVANASAKMKLSSEQTEGALRALEQMISKGNVQAEELRGQLAERLPGAFAIAARAMGVTKQQLNKMLEDGAVLASDLLPKLAVELDKTFGNDSKARITGLTAAWARFKNVFQFGVDENANISKFFSIVLESVTTVSERIVKAVNSTSWKEFFFRLGAANVGMGNPAMSSVQESMANATRAANDYAGRSNQSKILEQFKRMTREEQKQLLEAQSQLVTNSGETFNRRHLASDKRYYEEQVEILKALSKAYRDAWRTKKEFSEGGDGGSNGDGNSQTKKEISALELLRQKIAAIKEGFQLQALAAIQAGKSFAPSVETIKQLDKLQEQLEYAETLGRGKPIEIKIKVSDDGVKDANSAGGLNAKGTSVKPIDVSSASDKSYIARRTAEVKQSIEDAVFVLRESNELIAEAFGYETGQLFDSLANNLQNFLDKSGNGWEDWARTAVAAAQAVDEQFAIASNARIDQYEREKDLKIKLAGDNADAIEAIEGEANRKIAEERKKQARISKTAAMFEIAINTAIAASKVVGQTGLFGLPLVPLIIAMGAAQLALVAAQPLPEFFVGTDNAPKGPAHVAERGREMIIDKKGNLRLIEEHSIYPFQGGEQVLTNSETERVIESIRYNQMASSHKAMAQGVHDARLSDQKIILQSLKMDEKRIGKIVGEEVGKHIAEIPVNNWSVDEEGFKRSIRKGNTTVNIINKKNSL